MSRLHATFFVLFFISTTFFASENYKQVKVFANLNQVKEIVDLGIALDHAHKSKDNSIIFFVSDSEFEQLQKLNLQMEVLIDDWERFYSERKKFSKIDKQVQLNPSAIKYGVNNFELGSMGGNYTLDEVTAMIENLLDNYPDLVGGEEVIGRSNEGLDMFAFKVSVNPDVDEDEPEVLYTALHHAREPESMMQMFYFIQYLLENYETNDEVNYLLNNRELYFIPVVNPDGYAYNENTNPNGGGMWRKNRRDNGNGSHGVDLNRNYGPYEYWNAPNGGSSDNTYSSTYRGEKPFSEPETEAIRYFLNNHDIKACLNYHSFSNLLIYPYGAIDSETPDSNTYREFAVDMTWQNNYSIGTDMQTVNYSTRGNSDDYMYDGEPGRDLIYAMTPEVGSFMDSFWPSENRIIPLAEENILPNLYYANVAGSYPTIVGFTTNLESILPGDEFILTPIIKNKGLGDSGEFEVKISSLNEFASVMTDNALIIQSLGAQSSANAETGVGIKTAENADSELSFEFRILQNGLVRNVDTLNLKLGRKIILFADDAESDSLETNWTTEGSGKKWAKTSSYSFSGKYSYTDSKSGNYSSSSSTSLVMINPIDVSGISNAYLNFQTRFQTEASYDGGVVQVSSDNGTNWNVVGGHLAKPATSYLGSIEVAEGEPVYTNALFNWGEEEIDLSDYLGESILIRLTFYSDSYLENDGWYLDDIQVVSYESTTGLNNEEIVYQFSIDQNYPNPFNPSTTISFTVPTPPHPSPYQGEGAREGFVLLRVYDILGREVITLVNKPMQPGNHEVTFDGSDLTSGVYFYALTAGNIVQSRKMMLIK